MGRIDRLIFIIMKKLIFMAAAAALLLASAPVGAQVRQYDYDIADFSVIEVGGNFEVTVQEGKDCHVTLTVDEKVKEYVECEKKGNKLVIGNSEKSLPAEIKKLLKNGMATFECKAVVTVCKPLKEVVLADKAILSCSMPLESENVSISVSDNANLKSVNVQCKSLEVKTDKKAAAAVIADAEGMNVDMSGSSALTLTQRGAAIDATVAALANLTLYCECEELNLNTKGTSKSLINGSAKRVRYNIAAASNVNALELESDEAVIKMNSVCTLTESAKEKISLDLSAGATLVFNNTPAVVIEQIKASNVKKYVENAK